MRSTGRARTARRKGALDHVMQTRIQEESQPLSLHLATRQGRGFQKPSKPSPTTSTSRPQQGQGRYASEASTETSVEATRKATQARGVAEAQQGTPQHQGNDPRNTSDRTSPNAKPHGNAKRTNGKSQNKFKKAKTRSRRERREHRWGRIVTGRSNLPQPEVKSADMSQLSKSSPRRGVRLAQKAGCT